MKITCKLNYLLIFKPQLKNKKLCKNYFKIYDNFFPTKGKNNMYDLISNISVVIYCLFYKKLHQISQLFLTFNCTINILQTDLQKVITGTNLTVSLSAMYSGKDI